MIAVRWCCWGYRREARNLAWTLVLVDAQFGICGNTLERIEAVALWLIRIQSCRSLGKRGNDRLMRRSGSLDVADRLRFGALRNSAETEMRRMMTLRHGAVSSPGSQRPVGPCICVTLRSEDLHSRS